MNDNIYFVIILFTALFLASCQKEIEFELDQTPSKLVVNGLIAADSIIEVKIGKSLSYAINNESYNDIDDAVATLFVDDIEVEILPVIIDKDRFGRSEIVYRSQNTIAEVGKTYSLIVTQPDCETVKCKTTIPLPVKNAQTTTSVVIYNNFRESYPRLYLHMKFDKTHETEKFYRIYFERMKGTRFFNSSFDEGTAGFVGVEYGTCFYTRSDDPILNPEEKNVNNILFVPTRNTFGIFTDELTEGNEVEFSFYDEYINNDTTGHLININNGDFYRYSIYLSSLSPEAYYYFNSSNAQINNNQDLFAEPVLVYSNIENGLGIFAGYTTSLHTVSDGEYPIDGMNYEYWKMDIY
ncbi:MAG: DUF4249 domain-containing protein [Prolixibacteraceae bacterium]|jgi:hypothetical protein|nr:DUF4249 domain-containing protein [Prolixibacteraceae bacterium]